MRRIAKRETTKPTTTKKARSDRQSAARSEIAAAPEQRNGIVVLDQKTGITARKENVKRLRKFAEVFLSHLR